MLNFARAVSCLKYPLCYNKFANTAFSHNGHGVPKGV